ncbi:hypothetical protein DY000_02050810 [Brassica cretica]|uniref:RRM domain-containing protein n=1 Tax=Brassica cretica TaxID=69181 RepID=A0ABQ7EYN2_BRACR|nr:hypothetical protein DY000_02050810 [Brassica cretica]
MNRFNGVFKESAEDRACEGTINDIRVGGTSLVHFAATKDSLSRHFNKFGEVLKAVIVTDLATRQPSGLMLERSLLLGPRIELWRMRSRSRLIFSEIRWSWEGWRSQ